MKRFVIALLIVFGVCGLAANASATLYDRGNGMIYDDTLNVTWMDEFLYHSYGEVSDAQWLIGTINTVGYGKSTGFTDTGVYQFEVTNRGFTDWRLPTMQEYVTLGDQLLNNTFGPFVNVDYWSNPNLSPHFMEYWSSDFLVIDNGYAEPWQEYFTFNFADDSIRLQDPHSGWFPALAIRNGDVAIPTPEPGTMLLFGIGIAAVVYRDQKRKQIPAA